MGSFSASKSCGAEANRICRLRQHVRLVNASPSWTAIASFGLTNGEDGACNQRGAAIAIALGIGINLNRCMNLSRRSFFTAASALGAAGPAALSLLGAEAPARAAKPKL